jgi:hypothetical protein
VSGNWPEAKSAAGLNKTVNVAATASARRDSLDEFTNLYSRN